MILIRSLLFLVLLVLPLPVMAEEPALLLVEPVDGAAKPADTTLARLVAQEAHALGINATAESGEHPLLYLHGQAQAVTVLDGAALGVRWSVRDASGAEIAAFRVEGVAPYKSNNPWEALDGDTLRWFAATTARELETALQGVSEDAAAPSRKTATAKVPPGKSAAAKPSKEEQTGALAKRKVNITGVTGAPGDGNATLGRALAQMLAQLDVALVPDKSPDVFLIEGRVSLKSSGESEDTVSLLWLIKNTKGKELARIEQLNAVPRGSLAVRWGKTAVYAAEGAADGLVSAMSQIGARPPG